MPEHLRDLYAKCEKNKSKFSHEGLAETLVNFIKMGMYEYINKGYVGSYSPFWIFGSMKYKQNMKFIFNRKHVVEFDTVWLNYTAIKAKETEQDIKYISSFNSQPPKRKIIEIKSKRKVNEESRTETGEVSVWG